MLMSRQGSAETNTSREQGNSIPSALGVGIPTPVERRFSVSLISRLDHKTNDEIITKKKFNDACAHRCVNMLFAYLHQYTYMCTRASDAHKRRALLPTSDLVVVVVVVVVVVAVVFFV